MEKINSKAVVTHIMAKTLEILQNKGQDQFISALHDNLLKKKVRFPLLEYAAQQITMILPPDQHIALTDRIIELREIGSHVLAGIILQARLSYDFDHAIEKACGYIQYGNEWYVCDIIGERVLGYALLTDPQRTIPILKQLALHENKWIVRAVGVATHYAVKKGLDRSFVDLIFQLLLTCSDTTDFHTKKGIGWGAKTIARFHPHLIVQYQQQILAPTTRQWFRTKINIGLLRNQKS